MDKALYDKGMTMRRKVLGDEYVDRAVANTDDFNRQFQELLTTYCWGAVWGDEALKPRDRSLLWLAYAQGWSHAEIAASLGVKRASLKAMLHRARQRLAQIIRSTGDRS